jgi:hypothetical protein
MLTKKFIEIQINMSNAFGIILLYKMVWWFDNHNLGLESRRPKFNLPYQHILCGDIYIYILYYFILFYLYMYINV